MRAAQILACYRKNWASSTSAGQLVLPNCVKSLPLYIKCLLRTSSFRGVLTSVPDFYPWLTPVHGNQSDIRSNICWCAIRICPESRSIHNYPVPRDAERF
uniref:Protein transport protein Sec24D n=1 Tax=Culex pipiens TaxID=7175 RepID=A0A8D8DGK6_CULPI